MRASNQLVNRSKLVNLTEVMMTTKGMTWATQTTSPMKISIPQLDLRTYMSVN